MKKEITIKNYIILSIMCISAILLTLFILKWIDDYKVKKLSTSPLEGKVQEIEAKELDVVVSELNEAIVYIGYNNDNGTYTSEQRLYNYIKKHDLNNTFIYINVTDIKDTYQSLIKEKLSLGETTTLEAPTLIYIKNGEVVEIVNNDNGYLYTNDLVSLINKYEIEQ